MQASNVGKSSRLDSEFDRLLDLSPEQREHALYHDYAGDPKLRGELESLLRSAAAMGNFLSQPARPTPDGTTFAIGRLPFPSEAIAWLVYAICLAVPVIIDTARNHRLHPVFGWGAPAVFVSLYLVRQLATTRAWMHFAQQLVS